MLVELHWRSLFVGVFECFHATLSLLISQCERAWVDVNYFGVYLYIIIAMDCWKQQPASAGAKYSSSQWSTICHSNNVRSSKFNANLLFFYFWKRKLLRYVGIDIIDRVYWTSCL